MRPLDGFAGPVEVWPEEALCSDFVLASVEWSECADFIDPVFIDPDFVGFEDLLSRGTP